MSARSSLFLLLTCILFLAGGCATKETAVKPSPVIRFPEQPAAFLAKTPAQSLPSGRNQKNFQFNGGWGYGRNDAFVLTIPPGHHKKAYNNTIPLENLLLRTRNHVEFSETPPKGQRYVVVDHGRTSRTVGTRDGRVYAVWRGQMYLISEKDSPTLFQEAISRPLSRRHFTAATAMTRAVPREYWFDVTDTFNAQRSTKKVVTKPQSGAQTQRINGGKN